MANSLNEDKCEIQYQRYKGGEDELRLVVQRTEFLGRKVRKDHRETGQRNEDGQSGARALSLESLFAVADAAHQQTCTDDAVAHDHDRREDRVTCQSGFFGRRCDHDRDDEGRLDHRYGQGEDKRTEWLANEVCDHLRMVDCGKNGAEQSCSGCGVDGSASAENECDQQDCPRERGPNPRPPSRPCHSHADSPQKLVVRIVYEARKSWIPVQSEVLGGPSVVRAIDRPASGAEISGASVEDLPGFSASCVKEGTSIQIKTMAATILTAGTSR